MVEGEVPATHEAKRAMIEQDQPEFSMRRQCERIGLSRSSFSPVRGPKGAVTPPGPRW